MLVSILNGSLWGYLSMNLRSIIISSEVNLFY